MFFKYENKKLEVDIMSMTNERLKEIFHTLECQWENLVYEKYGMQCCKESIMEDLGLSEDEYKELFYNQK